MLHSLNTHHAKKLWKMQCYYYGSYITSSSSFLPSPPPLPLPSHPALFLLQSPFLLFFLPTQPSSSSFPPSPPPLSTPFPLTLPSHPALFLFQPPFLFLFLPTQPSSSSNPFSLPSLQRFLIGLSLHQHDYGLLHCLPHQHCPHQQ